MRWLIIPLIIITPWAILRSWIAWNDYKQGRWMKDQVEHGYFHYLVGGDEDGPK